MKILLIIFAILAYGISVFFALLVGAYAGEMRARKRKVLITMDKPRPGDTVGTFYIQEIQDEGRKPS